MHHRLPVVLVVLAVLALAGTALFASDSPVAAEAAPQAVEQGAPAVSEPPQDGAEAPAAIESSPGGEALPWLLPEPEPVHHCTVVSSWCDSCPGGIRWCYKDSCGITHCGSCGRYC